MSDDSEKTSIGRDALGILLFGLAAFAGISVVMSILEPAREPSGTTAVVTALVSAVGAIPALALSVGLAWLGARLWLSGIRPGTARELVGLAAVALALSILASAISSGAGGALGALTGEAVARQMTRLVAIPFGLVALAAPVWFLWMRPKTRFSEIEGEREAPAAAAPTESDGVSSAEAEALLPAVPERKSQKATALQQALETAATRRSTPPPTPLPPLYPPDVRLQGGIPEGTRPLAPTHEAPSNSGAPRSAAVHRQPAEGAARPLHRPGADLAPDPLRAAGPATIQSERPGPAVVPVHAAESRPVEPVATAQGLSLAIEPTPASEALLAETLAPHIDLTAPRVEVQPVERSPASPSWEAEGLFEEPVDAYGTPLALVEVLRRANAESAERLEDASDEVALADEASPPIAPLAIEAVEELEEELEGEDELEETESELEEDGELDAEADEDDEEEADEEDDETAAELDEEEAEDEDELETGEVRETEAEAELDEEEEQADEPELVATDAEELEPALADALFDVGEPAPIAAAPIAEVASESEVVGARAPVQAELFASAPAPEVEPAAREPELELVPVAAPRAQAEPVSGSEDLVFRAGVLILERKRVAVSMLQREFGLDFKAATDLLDQLQQAGLIGPYLGGQRRDILLTPEQWRERVGAV